MKKVKKIDNFMLPEHFNSVYKYEASSSLNLTKEVADKLNEVINLVNSFNDEDLQYKQGLEGTVRKAVLYMKDNLINTIHELLELFKDSGGLSSLITSTMLENDEYLLKLVEGMESVINLGADPTGVKDSTNEIQKAFNTGKVVLIPRGTYLISRTLHVPAGTIVIGSGRETVIKMVKALNDDINSILLLNGDHIQIENLCLNGSEVVNGISFNKDTYHFKLSNLLITNCLKGLYDYKSLWMGEFSNVHCRSCLVGFSFTNDNNKTSLTLSNCWCENCGQAYDFYRVSYSSLICCGCDFCNYITDSPYNKGYGSESDKRGVYNFSLCKGITMNGCGSENCYGNGVIKLGASSVVVNGFVATNIKSKFEPNYSTYPKYKVGDILLTAEKNKLILNGYCFNSKFENSYVKSVKPEDNQPIVAYNYSESTYGKQEHKSVIVSGLQDVGHVVFDGMGDFERDCVNLDSDMLNMKAESVSINGQRNFGSKKLHSSTEGTTLQLPLQPNGDYNYSHKLKITGLDASKSNTPKPFYLEVAFASSNSVKQIIVMQATEGITCTSSDCNLNINLPYAYNDLHVDCEAMSDKLELILWDQVKLI